MIKTLQDEKKTDGGDKTEGTEDKPLGTEKKVV